jgi:hypothetical protein
MNSLAVTKFEMLQKKYTDLSHKIKMDLVTKEVKNYPSLNISLLD